MILVLGGGFGLYGHVAALAGLGRPVASLARYRPIVAARPELAAFADEVEWIGDEREGLSRAAGVVLARRPADNHALARALCERGEGGTLVIEKPIAPSPDEAIALGERLGATGRSWAVPYLLLHCDWFDDLRERIARGRRVEIRWSFRRSPSLGAWKGEPGAGGGALAFYFVHCIALAESLLPGAEKSWFFETPAAGGQCVTLTTTANEARLTVEFILDAGDNGFRILEDEAVIHDRPTPFGETSAPGAPDPRVPILQRFYQEAVFGDAAQPPEFHRAVHELWSAMAGEGR